MPTNNLFSQPDIRVFLLEPTLWKCNCGHAQYTPGQRVYGTIICACGHELTEIEFNEYYSHFKAKRFAQETIEPGQKFDAGKARMELLQDFSLAFKAIAELAAIGAKRYGDSSWLQVPDGENRYTGALLRHLFTHEDVDGGEGGTGCLHDTCVAWNALARLELRLRREANDAN